MHSSLLRHPSCRAQAPGAQPRQARTRLACLGPRTPSPFFEGAALVAASTAAALVLSGGALAAEAGGLFTAKCAGNIVQAGATLFAEDLQKNGVTDPEALYNIIYSGKDKMPGFGTDCAPKGKCTFGARLPDEDIQGLAAFVQERAASNWQ